ncbi:MAG: PD-(D/E)XK nuclease family protein, partial [Eubacterium sp.]|nr:PD-(D/E)XK nuclease family protein [Eubacterium sp.]
EYASASKIIEGSVVVFDGFTGFTPVQMVLVRAIMEKAALCRFTVTADPSEDLMHPGGGEDLFHLSKKTVATLLNAASEAGASVLEPVLVESDANDRFADSPSLRALEKGLFNPDVRPVEMEGDDVHICAVESPREELAFCASTIRTMVAHGEFAPDEIAVVTGDIHRYADEAPAVFARYGLNVFVDSTVPVTYDAFVECVRGVLAVASADFSYESLFGLIRTGFISIERKAADVLEDYLLCCGIRGRSAWRRQWTYNPLKLEPAELESVNESRKMIISFFDDEQAQCLWKKSSVRDITLAVYSVLDAIGSGGRIEKMAEGFREKGDEIRSKRLYSVHKNVMKLFEKLVDFLGDDVVSIKEYTQLLEAGLSDMNFGMVPQSRDAVVLGDIERTRLSDVKVLFVIGVNDGVLPKKVPEGGIISELEREALIEGGLDLSPGARDNSLSQEFYMYINLTSPSHKLFLTYSIMGDADGVMTPSYLIREVERVFDGLETGGFSQEEGSGALSPGTLVPFFANGLRRVVEEGEIDSRWLVLMKWYKNNPAYAALADAVIKGSLFYDPAVSISEESVKALYGDVLNASISQLEKCAGCAFSYFLNYGLRLQERKLRSFEASDLGNIYHDAISEFTAWALENERDFHSLTDEEIESVALECVNNVLAGEDVVLNDDAAGGFRARRIRRVFKRSAGTICAQIKAGTFEPVWTEKGFKIDLDGTKRVKLRGRMDRVDITNKDEALVRVVDYKSSKKTLDLNGLYAGTSLQLLIYLKAAVDVLSAEKYGDYKPAGAFYYVMEDPIVKGSPQTMNASETELDREIRAELSLNGISVNDVAVMDAHDSSGDSKSIVANIARNSNGEARKDDKLVPMDVLDDYINDACYIAGRLGEQILSGAADVSPMRFSAENTSCRFCRFSAVCGFDPVSDHWDYRNKNDVAEARRAECESARTKGGDER